MDPGPEPSAQVGGAGEDVTKPLIPHKLPASLLDQTLHLRGREIATQCVFHSQNLGMFDGCVCSEHSLHNTLFVCVDLGYFRADRQRMQS